MKRSMDAKNHSTWFTPHANIRTDSYVLLAALLTDTPSEVVIELVRNLSWEKNLPQSLDEALTALNHVGTTCPVSAIDREFNRLFVGLGAGELIPYGSWYREKMIQSAPLAAIRADLDRLGIVRQSDCLEPEDHAGVLCEIMALLSGPEFEISGNEQAVFFNRHVGTWMPQFFNDLRTAKKCDFYRMVGAFGCCFMAGEQEYLHHLSNSCLEETILHKP